MNRVKLNVKTRAPIVDRVDKPPCGICKRQISNYTCPTCNIPYCSLNCFKSETHGKCSEAFYLKEIEEEIKTSPNKSLEERRKMMELLQKFEQESHENEEGLEGDDNDDDLAQKLEGVNLDEVDPDTLLSFLSPAQQEAFFKALKDPTSELAQELLASDELHKNLQKPWWESPDLGTEDSEDEVQLSNSQYGKPPSMITVPEDLIPKAVNAPVIYNNFALCVAYAYVTRRISISPLSSLGAKDPDHGVVQDLLSSILPFLIERSTFVYRSVDDVVTSTWAKLEAISDPPTNESFHLLLTDVSTLLQPKPVALLSEHDSTSLPSPLALLSISDIINIFESASRFKHVVRKLNFYAAHLAGQNPQVLKAVSEEARLTALKMKVNDLKAARGNE